MPAIREMNCIDSVHSLSKFMFQNIFGTRKNWRDKRAQEEGEG